MKTNYALADVAALFASVVAKVTSAIALSNIFCLSDHKIQVDLSDLKSDMQDTIKDCEDATEDCIEATNEAKDASYLALCP